MALCPETTARYTQGIRKLERPRPLRACFGSGAMPSHPSLVDATMLPDRHETVPAESGASGDECGASIDDICDIFREKGASLEKVLKEDLDNFFDLLRDACRDDRVNVVRRTKFLEVIELRAMGWKLDDDRAEDYSRKCEGAESSESRNVAACQFSGPRQQQNAPPRSLDSPDKPVNDLGWRLPKDEIAVRKPDPEKGGQSLQNWPMQNAGHANKAITAAKEPGDVIGQCIVPLAQETWNATSDALGSKSALQKPLLVPNWSGGDPRVGEYASTVTIGRDTIHITGLNADLVRTAALAVKDYFASHFKNSSDGVGTNFPTPTLERLCTALEHLKLSSARNAPGVHAEASLQQAAVPKLIGSRRSVASQLRAMCGNGGPEMNGVHPPPSYEQSFMTSATGVQCSDCRNDIQGTDELPSLQRGGSSWTPEPRAPPCNNSGDGQRFKEILRQLTDKTAACEMQQASRANSTKSLPVQANFETSHDAGTSAETKGYKTPSNSQQLTNFLDDMQIHFSVNRTVTATRALEQESRPNSMKTLPVQTGFETLRHDAPAETKVHKTSGGSQEISSFVGNIEVPSLTIHTEKDTAQAEDINSLPVQTGCETSGHARKVQGTPFTTEKCKITGSSQFSSSLDQDSRALPSAIQTTATHTVNASRPDATKSLLAQASFNVSDHASAPSQTMGYKTTGSRPKNFSNSLDQDAEKPPPRADGSSCGTQSKKCYSRDFLLQCSHTSFATQVPTDFPQLDPEVASVMVKTYRSTSNSKAKN